ncbi:hypothetical protein [Mesorhizobium ciceri]|uniref:hypothetical protein n=2 Tax=Phyllobacteriaceae TaxID=69277 RepID=UPI003756CBCE
MNAAGNKGNMSASVLNAIGVTAGETAGYNIESPRTGRDGEHGGLGEVQGEWGQFWHHWFIPTKFMIILEATISRSDARSLAARPAATPARSAAFRFRVSLHLLSSLVIGMRKPTIPRELRLY